MFKGAKGNLIKRKSTLFWTSNRDPANKASSSTLSLSSGHSSHRGPTPISDLRGFEPSGWPKFGSITALERVNSTSDLGLGFRRHGSKTRRGFLRLDRFQLFEFQQISQWVCIESFVFRLFPDLRPSDPFLVSPFYGFEFFEIASNFFDALDASNWTKMIEI